MNNNKNEKLPVLYSAQKLDIKFPEPLEQIKKEGEKTIKLIKSQGTYTPKGQVFINRKSISHLLATDSKGGRILYNNLDEEDKMENGQEKYTTVESIQKEISKRIQEPRDTIQRERLKYSEDALKVFRDTPELEKIRELEESKIRKELPIVKQKKLRVEKIDEITGEPLTNPDIHHKDRVADNPRRALDDKNLSALNKPTHDFLHKNGIETEEEFEKYKKANKS